MALYASCFSPTTSTIPACTCSAIQQLARKVAQLEAGLSALLSGQAIPPAAAAALVAAISRMRPPSGQLAQALSKSAGGASYGSRSPSSGAAHSTGDASRGGVVHVKTKLAASGTPAGGGAGQQEAADELDSVIQAINEASDMRGRLGCC
jgi:hypothetical protein